MKIITRAAQCKAIKKDGTRCRGNGYGPKMLCYLHTHPENAAKCGIKGGKRRAVYDLSELAEVPKPRTAAEVLNLLSTTVVEVRAGKMETKLSANIAYVCGHILAAIELEDLEKQVTEILKAPAQPTLRLPPLPKGAIRVGGKDDDGGETIN